MPDDSLLLERIKAAVDDLRELYKQYPQSMLRSQLPASYYQRESIIKKTIVAEGYRFQDLLQSMSEEDDSRMRMCVAQALESGVQRLGEVTMNLAKRLSTDPDAIVRFNVPAMLVDVPDGYRDRAFVVLSRLSEDRNADVRGRALRILAQELLCSRAEDVVAMLERHIGERDESLLSELMLGLLGSFMRGCRDARICDLILAVCHSKSKRIRETAIHRLVRLCRENPDEWSSYLQKLLRHPRRDVRNYTSWLLSPEGIQTERIAIGLAKQAEGIVRRFRGSEETNSAGSC